MSLLPGLPLIVVGALVVVGHRRIAAFFTSMQQKDKLYAHPQAGFFQKLNTLAFGIGLTVVGLVKLLS